MLIFRNGSISGAKPAMPVKLLRVRIIVTTTSWDSPRGPTAPYSMRARIRASPRSSLLFFPGNDVGPQCIEVFGSSPHGGIVFLPFVAVYAARAPLTGKGAQINSALRVQHP